MGNFVNCPFIEKKVKKKKLDNDSYKHFPTNPKSQYKSTTNINDNDYVDNNGFAVIPKEY